MLYAHALLTHAHALLMRRHTVLHAPARQLVEDAALTQLIHERAVRIANIVLAEHDPVCRLARVYPAKRTEPALLQRRQRDGMQPTPLAQPFARGRRGFVRPDEVQRLSRLVQRQRIHLQQHTSSVKIAKAAEEQEEEPRLLRRVPNQPREYALITKVGVGECERDGRLRHPSRGTGCLAKGNRTTR